MKHHMLRLSIIILLWLAIGGCATGIKPPNNAKRAEQTLLTTAYCDCGKCCNWKRKWTGKPVIASGPNKGQPKKIGITASGAKAKPGTIAADTRLYPFGTIMYIPGYGYGRVEDRGSAIQGQHIDLFFTSHQQALNWGRKNKRVTIWR